MTDDLYEQWTAKIKSLADIRLIAIEDADSIIREFPRSIKLGKPVDLLPNMTEEEKAALAQADAAINIPEQQALVEAIKSDNKHMRAEVTA